MPIVGGETPQELVYQGNRLAELYWHASTRKSPTSEHLDQQKRLVVAGRPLGIVEFGANEVAQFPRGATHVDPLAVRGAILAFMWLATGWDAVGTWFLHPGSADDEALRSLRLSLLRLHAERQVLDLVIRAIDTQVVAIAPESEPTQRLQSYIERATTVVAKSRSFGVSQSAIAEAYEAATRVDRPYELDELAHRYEGLRRQIARKLAVYQLERGARREIIQHTVEVREGGIYVEQNTGTVGDQISGNTLVNSPGAGLGKNVTASASNVAMSVGGDEIARVDAKALEDALIALHSALGEMSLTPSTKISVQTQVGQAIGEGVTKDDVKVDVVAQRVKAVGDTLKQANEVVKEGSSLWTSVQQLMAVLGPVVGGARLVAGWFGVPVP